METDIFRRRVCAICERIEWKPLIGTKKFDGGFATDNQFEPSEYIEVRVGNKSWTTCPDCANAILRDIECISGAVKAGRSV